jgi:hypothetical protein
MKIGTKSVLFGVHQFAIHPLVLAFAWWQLHRFRRVADAYVTTSLLDPRLWFAFVVHDLGYIGKPNMDGFEGEEHPRFGATILGELFGGHWYCFSLYHSRYFAKREGMAPSALCLADKQAIVTEPSWLYLPRAKATGELAEYLAVGRKRAIAYQPTDAVTKIEAAEIGSGIPRIWHRGVKSYMGRWIAEHRDGREDSWTRVRTNHA